MKAHRVSITYHRENDTWWADSDDVPGFSAAADTFAETRKLVRDGLAFYFEDDEPSRVREFLESGAEVLPNNTMFVLPNRSASKNGENEIAITPIPATTTANRGIKKNRMVA